MGQIYIDMTLTLTIIISCLVVIIGWYIVHVLTSNRDHKNKKRELRLEYLINAYRVIGAAVGRGSSSDQFRNLESAFHDIQLFGSSEQLLLLSEIFISQSHNGGFNVEPLLNSLRVELRGLLDLSVASENLRFFRAE